MVTTRRRSTLHGEDVTTTIKSSLPPRSTKATTVQVDRQHGSIPSLPSGSLSCTRRQSSRRKSSANLRPPRNEKSSKELLCRTDHARAAATPPSKQTMGNVEHILPRSNSKRDPTKEGRHFLGGINLNKCQDIMAIPSPPTPRSGERKQQRRLSMSFLSNKLATPLQDLTNTDAPSSLNIKDDNTASRAERSKKRRSLCHVPSPLENEKQLSSKSPPAQSGIVLEEQEDEEQQEQRRKRTKRRQSLLLPSDQTEAFGIPPIALAPEAKASEIMDIPAAKTAESLNFADLQKLVRGYFSDTNNSQHQLQCADSIQAKTGYILGSHHLVNNTVASSNADAMNTLRAGLLGKQAVIMQMDKERKGQAEEEKLLMRCSIEKSAKGKYSYKDLSGKRLSRGEYKARYNEMIARQKLEKMQTFHCIMRQQLGPISEAKIPSSTSLDTGNADRNEDFVPPAAVQKHQPSNEGMDYDAIRPSFSHSKNVTTKNPSTVMSPSPLDSFTQKGNLKLENEQRNDKSDGSGLKENMPQAAHAKAAVTRSSSNGVDEVDEPDGLLPLPSREEESEDPEIAAAESKLWRAIDSALEDYSMEVLAIQERRRAITKRNERSHSVP